MLYTPKSCLQIILKLLSRVKLKHICAGIFIILILEFFGVFTHIFETSFDDNFIYPYEGDIHDFVVALRHNEKPDVPPINVYNYSFIHDIKSKCIEPNVRALRLIFLVKSAVENFDRRMAIRHSWGFEKRFSDVPFKTVFLLGTHFDDNELRTKVNLEAVKYDDIIQADFFDSYYNNTIKTMMGFKWAVDYCPNSKFYMFVDDDMYISVKNVLRFTRNPALYPEYLRDGINMKDILHLKARSKRSNIKEIKRFEAVNEIKNLSHDSDFKNNIMNDKTLNSRKRRQVYDFELPDDVRLFAGYVFVSAPHRHRSSKWYVSLKEYPYHMWPPYITAGAYILSREALLDMYYASMYTKHFRFDDIFLGIVAKKADIEPFHCEEFHYYKKDYTKYNYKYVISSHGYGNSEELLQVWNEQKAIGNA